MDDPKDWREVADRIAPIGRGAAYRLSQRLGMNSSFLYRKLKNGGELTARQAQAVRQFLDGAPDEETVEPLRVGGAQRIPEYGYAAATSDQDDRIAFNSGDVLDWVELPMGMQIRGDAFIVRTLGSSMEPRVFAGERLVAQRNMPPARGQDVLIEFQDGSAVLKTYRGRGSGKVFAEQWNPKQDREYKLVEVKTLHAVFCRL